MQKIILRIAVFAWVLASAITWADETLYTHKPGESSKGAQAVPQNYIDYSKYLSPYAEIEITRQLAQAQVTAGLRDGTLFDETAALSKATYKALLQYIDYSKYLSPAAEIDITRQLAQAQVTAGLRDGALFDEAASASEKTFKALFLPQDQYEEMLALQASPQASSAAVFVPSGNICCNSLDPQWPHLGKGPGDVLVPKAKSAGSCAFIHTGPGASPPTLTLKLAQVLYRLGSYGQTISGQPAGAARPIIWVATHTRTGLGPPRLTWSSRKDGAQVFGWCLSPSDPAYYGATYTHMNFVWITAPPGWVYIGVNPLPVGIVKRRYFSC